MLEISKAREEIKKKGYFVLSGHIDSETLRTIREFWLNHYRNNPPKDKVTWGPYLGQPNTIGFTDDGFQCLYRSCDFLWNPPLHEPTRNACLKLNAIRNQILGLEADFGRYYSSERWGVFLTTSYYPPGKGWMEAHTDGAGSDVPLVHHIAPLTFKGTDYAGGGMFLIDPEGKEIDVDSLMTPGDVVFYDASLKHGVKPIQPLPSGAPLGRLQMFAIPSQFLPADVNSTVIERIAWKTFLKTKWYRFKSDTYHRLGRKPFLR